MGGSLIDVAAPNTSAISTPNRKPMSVPLPEDVLVQDPPKGLSELQNVISIDEGIHNRVSMGEDDGDVHHPDMCTATVPTQVVETVNDVQRKPTQSKPTHNDGQRFGSMHLLLQG